MSNLLPISQKKHLKTEYRLRQAVVVSDFLTFTFFLALGALFSVWLIVQSVAMSSKATLANKEAEQVDSLSATEADLNELKLKISTLEAAEKAQSLVPSELMSSILRASEEEVGVRVDAVDFVRLGEGTRLTVRGEAATREALQAFQGKLEQNPLFGSTNLPLNNFSKSENIPFSLEITIAES